MVLNEYKKRLSHYIRSISSVRILGNLLNYKTKINNGIEKVETVFCVGRTVTDSSYNRETK